MIVKILCIQAFIGIAEEYGVLELAAVDTGLLPRKMTKILSRDELLTQFNISKELSMFQ